MFSYDDLKHSAVFEENKSKFQGHCCKVKSLSEVSAAVNALFQNTACANSNHITYAYHVVDETSQLPITGHNDDGEWGTAEQLANLVRQTHSENVFVAVNGYFGGTNLGARRFAIITETATEALNKIDT